MKRIIVKMLMYFCLMPSILLILLTPFIVFHGKSLIYIIPCLILILPFLLPYLFLRKYANKKGYLDKKNKQNNFDKANETSSYQTDNEDIIISETFVPISNSSNIDTVKNNDDYIDEDNEDFYDLWKVSSDKNVRSLENKMIVKEDKELLHPDEIIAKYETAIDSYYELKKYCNSLGKHGKKYFKDNWQHCFNSHNKDFDFIDSLKSKLENYKKDYELHIKQYSNTKETLERVSNPLDKKLNRYYDGNARYYRIEDRSSIYANETNTFTSSAGIKCIDFEETILKYADLYKESRCPYCREIIELPKMKKSCPICKNKVYVVKGGIKQGNMVLKEEDKIKLYKLRDDFRTDKRYNLNYGSAIIVDSNTSSIESNDHKTIK